MANIQQVLEFTAYGKDTRHPGGAQRALWLCRALTEYVKRTKSIRTTNQLFVTFRPGAQGRAVRAPTIATWLKKAISMSYSLQGKELHKGIRAHGPSRAHGPI